MLQSIRNRAQGVFAWVVLGLICIPFAFWGIQNYMGNGQEQAVALVGDKEIFQRDITRAYEQIAARIGDIGSLDEDTLKQVALKNLIDEEVLKQSVDRDGFKVSDGHVRDTISSLPYFQNDGKFDQSKYESVLSAQGLPESYFVLQIREGLEIAQLREGITTSSFATQQEIDRFLKLRDQQRTVEYITIPVNESSAEMTDKAIKKYYQDNITSFQVPEKVSVKYLELSLEQLAAKVDVGDQDLLEFYERQKENYTKPERRKVSHILVSAASGADQDVSDKALKKISEIQQLLKDSDFATVARQMSDDKASGKDGGNLGVINPGDMDANFEEAAFSLQLNEVSEPVKSAFGYHLIKLTELKAVEIKPFAQVQAEVEKSYRRQTAENTFYELGETLEQDSYENSGSLEPTAESTGLEIKTSEFFTRGHKDGFGSHKLINQVAFSTEVLEGNNSTPIEISSEKVIVLRIDQHIAAENKPLAEVKQEIVRSLRLETAKAATKTSAENIYSLLKKDSNLSEIAGENNYKLETPEPLTRTSNAVPRVLIRDLFRSAKPQQGKSIPLLIAMPEGQYVVASLLSVSEPAAKPEDNDKQQELARQWMSSEYGNAEFSEALAHLRDSTSISKLETLEQ